jgi:predicted nucleotide-binding protein
MNMGENQKMIDELKIFLKELKSYKRRLGSDKQASEAEKRYTESLRGKLVRKSGNLKATVIQLTGKQFYTRFGRISDFWTEGLSPSGDNWACLGLCIDATNEAIGKLESTPIAELELHGVKISEPPKAFIAHGGETPALDKLKKYLIALGIEPVIVDEQASENRSTGNNVDSYAKQADCAIILATKGDIDGVTGGFIPRGNVLVEIGKAQELFKDRIIYLLQAGTKFPTNVSEKVWGRFTSSCMDEAFIKVARELTAFGILKAVTPLK